jgi:hypothetical protein
MEAKKMKKQLLYALTLTLGIAAAWLVTESAYGPQIRSGNTDPVVDAATRDGAFEAKIDVQNGRKAHLASGRWSTDRDRALYIAGYRQAYRELTKTSDKWTQPTAAERAGYRDGMVDGARHRGASQPFQGHKTDNYRSANRGYSDVNADLEKYRQYYRQAYADGYQRGYYSQLDSAELELISER